MHPTGIHHVTGIVRDARANVDFYTDTLGLRFLKRTVNMEDRFEYHFHYGDATGSAGRAVTVTPSVSAIPPPRDPAFVGSGSGVLVKKPVMCPGTKACATVVIPALGRPVA